MKTLQDAGQFLLRGHHAARAEWMLHATVHNLRNLATHHHKLPPTSPNRMHATTSEVPHDIGKTLHGLAAALTPAPASA